MNRTDRLLAIVLELQAKGRQRAEDLGATFEVSKRTIYRDIQALCEAGVPVVASPGQGYALGEGYFLPPLQFSRDEAIMLLVGGEMVAPRVDAALQAATRSASRKIAGVLPADVRAAVDLQRDRMRMLPGGEGRPGGMALLLPLRRAIDQGRRVSFTYVARPGDDEASVITSRRVDPWRLTHLGGAWYLSAFCHARQARRIFRLDRMEGLTLLDETFIPPPEATTAPPGEDDRALLVRVCFDPAVARWVREARSFYTVAEEEGPAGLLVTLRVRRERDVLSWLLSWGARVRVLEPRSLRARLAHEAAAMLARHGEPPTSC
jgi:predicted DNA-binding transcriptional regulator YafY